MKINKYLVAFVILFVGINTLLLTIIRKYSLLLLHHAIFLCQEMAKTFPIRLPGNMGTVVFLGLSGILLVTAIKLIVTLLKIYNYKKQLNKSKVNTIQLDNLFERINILSKTIIVNSPKPFAICFGIRQPKIYISTKLITLLSLKELEVVLRHEKYHLENKDTFTLLVASVFESLIPYVPLISDLIGQYRTEREIFADKAACTNIKENMHLVTVLTKLLSYSSQSTFVGVPAIADEDTLEVRIKRLTNKTYSVRQVKLKNLVISLISIGFLLTLLLTPVNAVELHVNNHDAMIVCSMKYSCSTSCKQSGTAQLQSVISSYSSASYFSH